VLPQARELKASFVGSAIGVCLLTDSDGEISADCEVSGRLCIGGFRFAISTHARGFYGVMGSLQFRE